MIKPIPSHLKLVTDSPSDAPPGDRDSTAWLSACQAFEQATGWGLHENAGSATQVKSNLMVSPPANPGVGATLGQFRLVCRSTEDGDDLSARVPLAQAKRLAESMLALRCELEATRRALRDREAELAAGVPLTHLRDGSNSVTSDRNSLAETLAGALRAGAEAIGCQKAALYLLDEGTSVLKLRASHGYPVSKLLDPARPLRGSLADLEALLGHAVVLSTPELFGYWHAPDSGGAAVCVPVCTSTTQLGTLWLFADAARDFSDVQTNVAELTAGRIAVELERQMLLEEGASQRRKASDQQRAEEVCTGQAPTVAPLIDGWEVAGTSWQAGQIGGAWHDWFSAAALSPAGNIEAAVTIAGGLAHGGGTAGAIGAAALRGAARGRAAVDVAPAELVRLMESIAEAAADGTPPAGLFSVRLQPNVGWLSAAVAGNAQGILLPADRLKAANNAKNQSLTSKAPVAPRVLIAGEPSGKRVITECADLQPGDLLLLWCVEHLQSGASPGGLKAFFSDLCGELTEARRATAERALHAAAELLIVDDRGRETEGSLVVIRRR